MSDQAEPSASKLKAGLKRLSKRLGTLDQVYDSAPIGLCVLDTDLRFVRINQRLADINGLPIDAHLGRLVREVVPGLATSSEALLRRVLETGQPVMGAEVSAETPAEPGRLRHWLENWQPLHDANGQIIGVNVAVLDVTAQKEAEAALRESEARFRASQELLPDGFCILRAVRAASGEVADFVWEFSNRAAFQLLNADSEDLEGKSVLERMPAHRDNPVLFPRYALCVQTGAGSSVEMPYEQHGEVRWYNNAIARIDPDRIGVLFRDITARKTAEHERQRLASIVESASDFIGVSDLAMNVIFVNSCGMKLLGMESAEAVRRTRIPDYFAPGDALRIETEVVPAVLGQGRWTGELSFRNMKTGRLVPVIYDAFRIDDPASGAPANIAMLTRDISERKQSEDRLRDSERRLSAVLNNTRMAVFMMNADQHCVYMNAAAEALSGYSLPEIQGRVLHDVIHHSYPDGRPYPLHDCPIDRGLNDQNQVQGEENFVHKNGRFYAVAFTASPIRDSEGGIVGTVLEVRDIRQEKEDSLRLEMMIDELNHRVKNSLATVQSIVWQALRSHPVASGVKEAIESRVMALSRSHDLLTRRSWSSAPLGEVVLKSLEPFGITDSHSERFSIEGPEVHLRPNAALALSLGLHELATNAAKYGALATEKGIVRVTWQPGLDGGVGLLWREEGGPPVEPPRRRGFGSKLIERGLAHELNGAVRLTYAPGGVACEIEVPPDNLRSCDR